MSQIKKIALLDGRVCVDKLTRTQAHKHSRLQNPEIGVFFFSSGGEWLRFSDRPQTLLKQRPFFSSFI